MPPYDGPYNMEDIRWLISNKSFGIGYDKNYCHTHPEEIMRRVPGVTRREAEHIIQLGLDPDEEVDFAYIAHNIGLDIFYLTNAMYIAR